MPESKFDDQIRAEMPPRPKLQRGVPSAENAAWDRDYLTRYFPRGGPVYSPRRRTKQAQQPKDSTQ